MLKKYFLWTKNAYFFLSRAPTHHSFTFNLQFLYELKHKVHLSETVCGIFHFRFRFRFRQAVLHGSDAFSFLLLSTKKRYSSFLKKVFVFQKICLKIKVLKSFKISTDCYIKTCRSLKQRVILKIPSTVFQKNLCSFCWFQNETSKKKRFPVLRQKATQILP